jgi:F-type H+-transporting ATPase subunit gamma
MKMVAGARLTRAQHRILALRPYAARTASVLREVTAVASHRARDGGEVDHPLLTLRQEKSVLLLVISSDRGLCGAFNTNILRAAEREWRTRTKAGQNVQIAVIGRKGRDFFRRRNAPLFHVFEGVWDRLDFEQARGVARTVLSPFIAGSVDAILVVYNEFKSAMTQRVVAEALFPLAAVAPEEGVDSELKKDDWEREFLFEPSKTALLERLVPMYVEVSLLRALLESMASELGARMTAMDAATKNASEMIDKLTLQYNRARQAAITTELMEIIGGAEALAG